MTSKSILGIILVAFVFSLILLVNQLVIADNGIHLDKKKVFSIINETGIENTSKNFIIKNYKTNKNDLVKLVSEINELHTKFPNKVQGNLIGKIAEINMEWKSLEAPKVHVEINLDSKESLPRIKEFQIIDHNENYAVLEITEKELEKLVLISEVKTVGLPIGPQKIAHNISEGVSFMGADQMGNAGYTGNEIKIAVIDAGVDPTDTEFSSNVAHSQLFDSTNFCNGDIKCGDSTHGDAISEIIVDMAPNVDLFLYTVGISNTDFGNAIDDAVSKDVDIMSISLGYYQGSQSTSYYRDGTSFVANKINQANNAGVLPVISAGNDGKQHWKGSYSASSSIANSLGLTNLGYQSVHVFNSDAAGNMRACLPVTDNGPSYLLTWNNWPTTNQDYDLIIFNSAMTGTIQQLGGLDFQTGSQAPMEQALSYSFGNICLVIASYLSNQNASFHLYTDYNNLQDSFEIRAGSIATPADATGALSVGAVDVSTNSLESFSSSGPTDDNRNKPEICGVDGTFSHQYSNNFFGTSASAPHVAGAAALLLEQNHLLSTSELKNKIIENTIKSTYSVNNLCGENSGVVNLSPLATPRNLIATVKSAAEIEISWSSYNTAIGYKIERESPIGGGFSTLIENTQNTNTTYNDAGLVAGISYNYRVSAIIPSGITNPSNTASATILAAPSAITDLSLSIIPPNSVNLNWTVPSDNGSPIRSYRIFRSVDSEVFSQIAILFGPEFTNYQDNTGLAAGNSVTYRVGVINSIGPSLLSNIPLPVVIPSNGDSDNDGILDDVDSCPLEPETMNNYQDTDGCPDIAPGSITIIKDTIPNNVQNFGFTTTGGLTPTNFALDDDEDPTFSNSRTFGNLTFGNYTITEGTVSGFSLSMICLDPDNGSTINLATRTAAIDLDPGENVICTYTNTQTGTITIIEDTIPNGPQNFSYVTSGLTPINFVLDDDADATLSNTRVYSNVVPGSYTVTENSASEFLLGNLTCSDPDNGTTINLSARTATIDLDSGESVICIYTNIQRGTMTIIKDTIPNNAQNFGYIATGLIPLNFVLDDDSDPILPNTRVYSNISPGNYTVTENLISGFRLASLVCTDPDNGSMVNLTTRTVTIDLDAGENITCTYTNFQTGSITIIEDTLPNGPQNFVYTTIGLIPANFGLDDDDDMLLLNIRAYNNIVPGSYSITQNLPAGFSLIGLSCVDPDNGSSVNLVTRVSIIDLDAGETITCTYTNTAN